MPADIPSRPLPRLSEAPRLVALVVCAALIAAGWLAMLAVHAESGVALDAIVALCGQIGSAAALWVYPSVAAMWLLMAVAMMLPTAIPTIDAHADLVARLPDRRGLRSLLFVIGYLFAWAAFGLVAAALQIALGAAIANGLSAATAAGAALVIAGAYQFSALKHACLTLCRNPMAYFLSRWCESLPGTFAMGVHHGIICVGCCWALMLLMFVTGAMNLIWMALLGLLMLAEKTLPHARTWGRALGGLLILAGAVTLLRQLI